IKKNLREELLPTLKQKDEIEIMHSIHPELGQVVPINKEIASQKEDALAQIKETKLTTSLADSQPPVEKEKPIEKIAKTEQDLGDLYQEFIEAQAKSSMEKIEYMVFLSAIEKAKK